LIKFFYCLYTKAVAVTTHPDTSKYHFGTVKTFKWHANHAVCHLKSTHCLQIVRLPDSLTMKVTALDLIS